MNTVAAVPLSRQAGLPPGRRVWLHTSVTDDEHLQASPALSQRVGVVLRHLALRGTTTVVKFVQGPARGWRRTPLGGHNGSHFYLWWSPAGTPPVKHMPHMGPDDILVRAIRHHDETSDPLVAGREEDFHDDYMDLQPAEILDPSYYGDILNEPQKAFAQSPARVRILRGHPGAGKTTALWEAAQCLHESRVLYITCSPAPAAEAQQFFECRDVPALVLTMRGLLESLLPDLPPPQAPGWKVHDGPLTLARHAISQWRWAQTIHRNRVEIYSELFAHWFGCALPFAFRTMRPAPGESLDPASYRELRGGSVPEETLRDVTLIAKCIADHREEALLFPYQVMARKAVDSLERGAPLPAALVTEGILVDEIQDLTPIEQYLLITLARRAQSPVFVAAGDEGQVVRPSDFQWGVLSDLLTQHLTQPEPFDVIANVRNPTPIVHLVNQSWKLYGTLSKTRRPRGYQRAHTAEPTAGRVFLVHARDEDELTPLLTWFQAGPGRRLINSCLFTDPDTHPWSSMAGVLSSSLAEKGVDYQAVGILDAGATLLALRSQLQSGTTTRSTIDAIRVAISRATETLVFIETAADPDPALGIIRELCHEVQEFAEITPFELALFLDRDDLEPEEMVHQCCAEARRLMGQDDVRAVQLARMAVATLGRATCPTSIQDPALRREAHHALGAAEYLRARQCDSIDGRVQSLKNARAAFQSVHNDGMERLMRELIKFTEAPSHGLEQVMRQACLLFGKMDTEVKLAIREDLVRWAQQLRTRDFARPFPPEPDAIASSFRDIAAHNPGIPGLAEAVTTARIHLATILEKHGKLQAALAVWRDLGESAFRQQANCLERMKAFREAAALWEEHRQLPEALRCLRRIPAPQDALRIAQELKDPIATHHLEWLVQFETMMREDNGQDLTPEEHSWVIQTAQNNSPGQSRRTPRKQEPSAGQAG